MRRGRFAVLAAAALALAGCAEQKRYDYRIVVIPKGLTHEFWQSIHRGAERAARDLEEEYGVRTQVIWDGPLRERDALAQIRIVDRRVSTRVDGIVLAPQHSKTMVAPVERAVERGVPVVIIDSGLDADDLERYRERHGTSLIVKYVATDNENGGRLAAERLLQVLDPGRERELNVVMLRYQVGSESTDKRERGFERRIDGEIAERERLGKPAVRWLSRDRYAGATKDSALREAKPLLNKLREQGARIDGIFAPNESSANGVLDALRSLGRGEERLVGFDSSEPLLQAIRDGEVEGLIIQDPYRMGYLGVWALVQHLGRKDKSAGPAGDFRGTGEYVLTRDEHDPGRGIFKVDSPEARQKFVPGEQEKRTGEELRR